MNQDIRLDMGFFGNLKTRKFKRELGDQGIACLIQLWCYVGERHPKGVLDGVSLEDLEEIAGWTGERGAFASDAVRMRWVDQGESGVLSIHDWKEHQPYIFHSDKRSEAARVASAARWEKPTKRGHSARRIRLASEGDTGPHPEGNPPSPDPDPDPDPKPKDLTANAPAGGSEAPAGAPKPAGIERPLLNPCHWNGCRRRGSISFGGKWYCSPHFQIVDKDPTVGRAIT